MEEAVTRLERTVDAVPAHLSAYILLARAYEVQNRWDDALRCWAVARTLLPNSPVAREGTARVLEKKAEEEASVEPDASGSAAPSELQELRRRAEEEARRGGARPGLAQTHGRSSEGPGEPPDTPEERVDALESDAEEDDLDRLIQDLESGRIEPDLEADPDREAAPEPAPGDDEELVSETLARIYESQEQYGEAARAYDTLADQQPDREAEFRRKAERMRSLAAEQEDDSDD